MSIYTEHGLTAVNREQWLSNATVLLEPLFAEIGVKLPDVRVSIGWPSKGGTRSKGKVIGQCWKSTVSTDGVSQLFISPLLGDDLLQTLGVLLHELIHAADDCNSGHKGNFATWAKKIGLGGKMTATVVIEDSELADRLRGILAELGPLPHATIRFEEMEKASSKQGTRMLKLEAECCGYIVRTTQKWLDTGMPSCPCGTEMELA